MKISKKIKNTTKLVLEPFLDKVGFIRKEEVLQYKVNNKSEKNKLISDFFTILKEIKFTPKHIVDVGANRGLWTREVIDCCPNAYYTLFEPQEYLHEYMKDLIENPKVECHAVGVGKQNGNLKFTIVDRDDSCSFIYSEAEAKALGFEQITVPVITLNDFFKDSSKPIPDLIKIDAEGFDLEVLQGATNLLGRTEIILIEAAVVKAKSKRFSPLSIFNSKGNITVEISFKANVALSISMK